MKYGGCLLAVADINRSRAFYESLFGLKVERDYGRNILFEGGLALQQDFDWLSGIAKSQITMRPNNMELFFEQTDFDSFLKLLQSFPQTQYVHDVRTHDWGQRVIRFYDPDGHLIEVGENMRAVTERWIVGGMTIDEITKQMDISADAVHALLNAPIEH